MYSPQNPSTIQLLASAARTATNSTNRIVPPRDMRSARIYIKATAASSTPSVVFTFQTYDPITATYYTLLTSAAVTGVSDNVYEISPSAAAVANLVAARQVGSSLRVTATHADSDSITYSINVEWLP